MHEGFNPAQALAQKGIAAFVLKNRLQSSGYKFDVEGLADMQRAVRVVRSRAAEWGVDPNRIGVSGVSRQAASWPSWSRFATIPGKPMPPIRSSG